MASYSDSIFLKWTSGGVILPIGLLGAVLCLFRFAYFPTLGDSPTDTSSWLPWSDGPFFVAIIPAVELIFDIYYLSRSADKKQSRIGPDEVHESTESDSEGGTTGDSHESDEDNDDIAPEMSLLERLFFIAGVVLISVPSFILQWSHHGPAAMSSGPRFIFSVCCTASSICCLSAIGNYLHRCGGYEWKTSPSLVLFSILYNLGSVLGIYASSSTASTDFALVSNAFLLAAAVLFIGCCLFRIITSVRAHGGIFTAIAQLTDDVMIIGSSDTQKASSDAQDSGKSAPSGRPVTLLSRRITLVMITSSALAILLPILVNSIQYIVIVANTVDSVQSPWDVMDFAPRSYTAVVAAVLVFMVDFQSRRSSVIQGLVRILL
jgi:hypothetical protein